LKIFKQIFFIFIFFCGIVTPFVRNGLSNLLQEKPLSEDTIETLKRSYLLISDYGEKYDVPKEVVLAAIGSEINRRIYINRVTDYIQNWVFSSVFCTNWLVNYLIEERSLPQNDLGLGNISLRTAWRIIENNKRDFPMIEDKKDMVDYLLTDEGNIHIACLIIKEGETLLKDYCHNTSKVEEHAIYYSYYKQGERFYFRYKAISNLKRAPIPGGGKEILIRISKSFNLNCYE
jgi:hypothetical protein